MPSNGNFGSFTGYNVDIFVSYDPSMMNADGSYTIYAASGTLDTFDKNGTPLHHDTILGLSSTDGDQHVFIVSNPMTTPIVDFVGINFKIDNNADSSDRAGNVNFYDFNGPQDGTAPKDAPIYYQFNTNPYSASSVTETPVCFATGSRIRTTRGDIPVEALVVGDRVVTVSGTHRPIRWIGHQTIKCATAGVSASGWPVRIRAGACGMGLPERDLILSPGHPVLVGADEDGQGNLSGGHLVPIMCLINGTSIARMPVDTVTYWHVELDAHDILLAEGLPAESYLDWGDRAFFTEGADHALANPDFVVPGLAGRCRPIALDGPIVEAERRRLDAVFAVGLAQACAWPDMGETPRGS